MARSAQKCVSAGMVRIAAAHLMRGGMPGLAAAGAALASKRKSPPMTLRVQQAEETILQHSVTPEETSLLSFIKELNVSAASIERVLQAGAGAGAPKVVTRQTQPVVAAGEHEQTQPASLLLRLLDAEDLAGMLVRFVPPCVAARCGLTCHAACNVCSFCQQVLKEVYIRLV